MSSHLHMLFLLPGMTSHFLPFIPIFSLLSYLILILLSRFKIHIQFGLNTPPPCLPNTLCVLLSEHLKEYDIIFYLSLCFLYRLQYPEYRKSTPGLGQCQTFSYILTERQALLGGGNIGRDGQTHIGHRIKVIWSRIPISQKTKTGCIQLVKNSYCKKNY